MTLLDESAARTLEPGTTGWTASMLDDPEIERQWFRGRYEIVEGVLTRMPAAYFAGGGSLQNLIFFLRDHVRDLGPEGSFATEVDIIVNERRVGVADAVFLTIEDRRRQDEAAHRAGRADPRRTRILIPPFLIIESVSPGHEDHDRHTKREWYARFGVPNYWIIDAYARSLECLVLDGPAYRVDQMGSDDSVLKPSAFAGLDVPLGKLWQV